MKASVSMRQALSDPQLLGSVLVGESWRLWRTMLIASMGERLTAGELAAFTAATGRPEAPPSRVEEALFLIGRRGGKDRAASVLATYLAALVDWSPVLAKGERAMVLCIGPDQRQAKISRDYIEGVFDASPILSGLMVNRTADTLELSSGISIEVRAANFRRLRGVTAVAIIATEAAFWQSEETSGNPDSEILNAVRPSLATTGGPVIIITTPYARRGEVWELYRRHYGPAGDPLILVAQGTTRDFNSTLPQAVVDRALERDPAAASAEFLAQFRTDVESFIAREVIDGAVVSGRYELPPASGASYVGFADAAGGSGGDSFTAAVAHLERVTNKIILDAIREHRPPFSPAATIEELSVFFQSYGVNRITADHWGGEFPREQFRKHGISCEVSERVKSDIYKELLPLLNSGKVDLLDNQRLITQLVGLERRTARGGRDSIDHPPNMHDDVANAVAGAVTLAAANTGTVIPRELLEKLRVQSRPMAYF